MLEPPPVMRQSAYHLGNPRDLHFPPRIRNAIPDAPSSAISKRVIYPTREQVYVGGVKAHLKTTTPQHVELYNLREIRRTRNALGHDIVYVYSNAIKTYAFNRGEPSEKQQYEWYKNIIKTLKETFDKVGTDTYFRDRASAFKDAIAHLLQGTDLISILEKSRRSVIIDANQENMLQIGYFATSKAETTPSTKFMLRINVKLLPDGLKIVNPRCGGTGGHVQLDRSLTCSQRTRILEERASRALQSACTQVKLSLYSPKSIERSLTNRMTNRPHTTITPLHESFINLLTMS